MDDNPFDLSFADALSAKRPALVLATDRRPVVTAGHLTVRPIGASAGADDAEQHHLELDGRDIMIGRLPSCDIAFESDTLTSRHHAMVRFQEGTYTVVDLGSSNGTYLNDAEITSEVVLHDGDRIQIGGHEIVVSSQSAPGSATQSMHLTGPLEPLPLNDTDPHLAAVSASAPEDAGSASPIAFSVLPSPAQPHAIAPSWHALPSQPASAAPLHDLDALQSQLTDMIGAMRHQAEEDAHTAEALRATLIELRDALADAWYAQLEPALPAFALNLGELIAIARMAAENPRYLDHVTGLAARAGEIAGALEALQALGAGTGLPTRLQAMRNRLDATLD